MVTLLWALGGFILGSLPFSVWLGQLALRTDIRRYGDHNPGAFNVMRAGGPALGLLAVFLDIMKGALPVGLAWYWAGLSGWSLGPIALAPVLGHAFSPLLKFQGGKAIATTYGIWIGLLTWEALIVTVGLLAVWYVLNRVDAWSVIFAMVCFLGYLLWTDRGLPLYTLWLGNFLVLVWKHRADLIQRPGPRPWLRRLVRL
ncbi:MAG TPA: glycerol-3-phosphate acyltransferase [Anaerolineae bacterium]|nr:glycerol-3-phosphate acyltransferase [Anaerolineae bacterium]